MKRSELKIVIDQVTWELESKTHPYRPHEVFYKIWKDQECVDSFASANVDYAKMKMIKAIASIDGDAILLDDRERMLVDMALAMKINHFDDGRVRREFGDERVNDVVEEFRALKEKINYNKQR